MFVHIFSTLLCWRIYKSDILIHATGCIPWRYREIPQIVQTVQKKRYMLIASNSFHTWEHLQCNRHAHRQQNKNRTPTADAGNYPCCFACIPCISIKCSHSSNEDSFQKESKSLASNPARYLKDFQECMNSFLIFGNLKFWNWCYCLFFTLVSDIPFNVKFNWLQEVTWLTECLIK
jgi:hypothetical protein